MILVERWEFWAGLVGLALVGAALFLRALRRRRIFFAALLEQGRREANHPVEYRHDQRVHAMQQRLSRHLGKRAAFSKKLRRRIEAALR